MYIVTGGAGFIGSAMIWKLNRMGIDDILVVDNLASSENGTISSTGNSPIISTGMNSGRFWMKTACTGK